MFQLRVLWYCVLLHTNESKNLLPNNSLYLWGNNKNFVGFLWVFGQTDRGFGTSYLKDSKLCQQWTCINTKLGLPDGLPPRDHFVTVLKSLLPQGAWQNVANQVADTCYNDRPRRYTNTCPGQSLLHCAVDHLIQFCPAESLRKDDACAPVTSLAGFKYMFSQSRYQDLEVNLPTERRPAWFLKNYFSSKCCNLPVLFNSTVLEECGFESLIRYHVHDPKQAYLYKSKNNNATTPTPNKEVLKIVNPDNLAPNMDIDPLECCDLSGFIEPSWRTECGFQMSWSERYRLTIVKPEPVVTSTIAPTSTTARQSHDVKLVPQKCEKVSCVFRKLNIISDSGSVDIEAFSKLLDNMTSEHPSWIKAKARVATKCLSKPIRDYNDDCEINKVLACTFDILSENCPHAQRNDPCKHTTTVKNTTTCQISSSKLRPKNRRQFCGLPSLVNPELLTECGMTSLSKMQYISDPVTPRPKAHWWTNYNFACQHTTDSTKCLIGKMGVLNKYGFLDYFEMKDRIRRFTTQKPEWSALTDVYLSTFTGMPMYGQQCTTPKKLLNVLDAMIMTCPISKRKISAQCNRIITDMADTAPANEIRLTRLTRQHQYLPPPPPSFHFQKLPVIPEMPVTHKTPSYNFGLLNSKDVPKVEIINVKPTSTWKPLVLLPVYMRLNGTGTGTFAVRPYDGILRSAPSHK